MSIERRRYPRFPSTISCRQLIGNQRLERQADNVSDGGMFIRMTPDETVRLGELVVFEISDGAQKIRVTGQVAMIKEDGFGVQVTRADWPQLSAMLHAAGE